MKHLVRLIAVALIAGIGAFAVTKKLTPPPPANGEIVWLESEFQLTPAQASKILALHEAYRPICAAHCDAIMATRESLTAATEPAKRSVMEDRLETLIATCNSSTREHLDAVAAAMDPAQGQRYLDMIGPRLTAHEHAQPLGLR